MRATRRWSKNAVTADLRQRIYAPLRDRTFHSPRGAQRGDQGRCWTQHNAALAFSGCPTHGASCSSRSSSTPWRRCRRTTSRVPPAHPGSDGPVATTITWSAARRPALLQQVPWHLRTRRPLPRTKVKLLYDERTVSIYYDNVRRLVEYQRDRRPGGCS